MFPSARRGLGAVDSGRSFRTNGKELEGPSVLSQLAELPHLLYRLSFCLFKMISLTEFPSEEKGSIKLHPARPPPTAPGQNPDFSLTFSVSLLSGAAEFMVKNTGLLGFPYRVF